MSNTFKIPIYAKAALIFICCFAFVFTMFVGRSIIVPILFALILAILINPMVNYFCRKGIHRLVSISIAVTLTVIVFFGTLFLISVRVNAFTETFPELKKKFEETNVEGVRWISKTFNVRQWQIKAWAKEKKSDAIDDFEFKENLAEVGKAMVTILLLPVYLFMILYYKPLLLEPVLGVYLDGLVKLAQVQVDGVPMRGRLTYPLDDALYNATDSTTVEATFQPGGGGRILTYFAGPARGIDLSFFAETTGPVPLVLLDQSYGLPDLQAEPVQPRPDDMMMKPFVVNDAVVVKRRVDV
jgi:hypothetical protein